MLFLIPYALVFWVFALISTIIKAARVQEISSERLSKLPTAVFIVIKILPALSATVFVLLFRPTQSLVYLLLAVAFIFCILGDIGMETKFLVGVGLFLLAQVLFIINFVWQSLLLGVSFLPLAAFAVALISWILVIVFLTQYIESGDGNLGKMKAPLIIYALTVSLTFCSALLLWLTSGVFLGFVPVLGAFAFVISDFTIGVKEFRHHFKRAQIFIFSTYYLAIFLLSMNRSATAPS